ncbi:MAG: hypothetical protein KatS3mg087_1330 [Patescibacteria group bacterium]|nr:MAG: hypothetical protein KatS3mg087_1330 [Patescibacteria group bacterium]
MQCWTYMDRRLVPGIKIYNDPKYGDCVLIGEGGPDSWYEKVKLYRTNPPDIKDDIIYLAHPIERRLKHPKNKTSIFLLTKPRKEDDPRLLLQLSTKGIYDSNSFAGTWRTVEGIAITILVGRGTIGSKSKKISWQEGLLVVYPNSVIHVNPLGAKDGGGRDCVQRSVYA